MTEKIVYENKINYSPDHWARHYSTSEDLEFIGRLCVGETEVIYKIDKTDSRGYHTLVVLGAEDMLNTLNRPYTFTEKYALHLGLSILTQAFENLGLLSQVEIAGNNSHEFDETTGVVHMGTKLRPSMFHAHVVGRGDPKHEYVSGVPLRGPLPGVPFRRDKEKVLWHPSEMKQVAQALKEQVVKVLKENHKLLGGQVIWNPV